MQPTAAAAAAAGLLLRTGFWLVLAAAAAAAASSSQWHLSASSHLQLHANSPVQLRQVSVRSDIECSSACGDGCVMFHFSRSSASCVTARILAEGGSTGGGGANFTDDGDWQLFVDEGLEARLLAMGQPVYQPPEIGSSSGEQLVVTFFNASGVGANGSVQTYVAPRNATYTISVAGASGGHYVKDSGEIDRPGGAGATMVCAVHLQQSLSLSIVVGQQGGSTPLRGSGAGGGGGSFVYVAGASPRLLLAAGGGGGGGEDGGSGAGQPGQSGQSGSTSTPEKASEDGAGGSGGSAGSVGLDINRSAGGVGAGWLGSGTMPAAGIGHGHPGQSLAGGWYGGRSDPVGADGGFGGGGGGCLKVDSFDGGSAGGGGGYSGGGVSGKEKIGGGGGGSFAAPECQEVVAATGGNQQSEGAVNISFVEEAAPGGVSAMLVANGEEQSFTALRTGVYRIVAFGASGGCHSAAYDTDPSVIFPPRHWYGGRGAKVQGDFNLTAGEAVRVICGMAGGDSNQTDELRPHLRKAAAAAGGGGGTFVYRSSDSSLMLAAGGGGGAAYGANGSDASGTGSGSSQGDGAAGTGGSSGNRSASCSTASVSGGAGGGWSSGSGSAASGDVGGDGSGRLSGWSGGQSPQLRQESAPSLLADLLREVAEAEAEAEVSAAAAPAAAAARAAAAAAPSATAPAASFLPTEISHDGGDTSP